VNLPQTASTMGVRLSAEIVTIYPVRCDPLRTIPVEGPTWAPVLSEAIDLEASDLVDALAHSDTASARCQLASVNGSACAVVLTVAHVSDEFAGVVTICNQLFDPKVRRTQQDQDLLDFGGKELLRLGGFGTDAHLQWLPVDVSYPHQLVFLHSGSATLHGAHLGTERLTPDAALAQLVFKELEIRYDPTLAPPTRPPDLAQPGGFDVRVWSTMTIVEGAETLPRQLPTRRPEQMIAANLQLLYARSEAVSIREAVLVRVSSPSDPDDDDSLVTLRDMRHRLLGQVAVLVSGIAVTGGRPLQSYYETLLVETDIKSVVAPTETFLGELIRIAEIDREYRQSKAQAEQLELSVRLASQQTQLLRTNTDLLRTSNTIRNIGIVIAAITAVIGTTALVSGLATIPASSENEWVHGVQRALVWAIGVTIAGAAAGFLIALVFQRSVGSRSGRRQDQRGLPGLLVGLVLSVYGLTVAALVLWGAVDWFGNGLGLLVLGGSLLLAALSTAVFVGIHARRRGLE
jgi:hypothetical protein